MITLIQKERIVKFIECKDIFLLEEKWCKKIPLLGNGYKFSKLEEKIIQLMYLDDIKVFLKNEKELESLI